MRILVIGGIVVTLAVIGAVVWQRPPMPTPPVIFPVQDPVDQARPSSGVADRPQVGQPPVAPPAKAAHIAGAPATLVPGQPVATLPERPVPPSRLAGFWSWSTERQETAVTLIQGDSNWPMEVRSFVIKAVQVRDLNLVTRNSMATGLMRQTPALPEFEMLLLRMCDDQAEDPEWRNYTLQFLAEVLPVANDRARVEQALRSFAAAEADPRAATAVLHLARLGATGSIVLDAAFDQQVLAMVQNQRQPPYARATALAVAGDRRITGVLELARGLAEPGHPGDMRRAAIGVLGSSNESQDQTRVQQYTQDADPGVRRVALANIKPR